MFQTNEPRLGSFFKKFLEDMSPFHGATDTRFELLVTSALGFQARVDPFCVLSHLCDPQFHLLGNTSWLHRGQHGSRAIFIHIPADVSTRIGRGLGHEPITVRATHSKHGAVTRPPGSAEMAVILQQASTWSSQRLFLNLLRNVTTNFYLGITSGLLNRKID